MTHAERLARFVAGAGWADLGPEVVEALKIRVLDSLGCALGALAIAGTAYNALRVTRTGSLSHWKGLAFPNTAGGALHATLLARGGITGPPEVFEGNKGWRWSVSGDWELDWSAEGLDRVLRTDLKKYNAEIHSQSAIEGLLELLDSRDLEAHRLRAVRVAIFEVAHDIIGGGEEGEKTDVRTKEQADHSLPYLLAVAALDRAVLPEQYDPGRIRSADVQELLRRVEVEPDEEYSARFPDEHACRVTVETQDGDTHSIEKSSYEGFHTRPMSWETVEAKFRELAGGASRVEALEEEGRQDPGAAIREAKQHLEAGAYMIMIESEGITEQVREWRTDVIAEIADELGLEKVMFEAADPEVFGWYVKNFGPEVNLFVDHSQIVQLECLRSGLWGTLDLWGRVRTYKG